MGTLERMMSMFGLQLGQQPNIACIGAHCDDIEIGCGGSIAALARQYPQSQFHCWVFSGSDERVAESRSCLSALLGPDRFTLTALDYRDGYFPSQWQDIKQDLSRLSQTVETHLVFTHATSDHHQDHRTLSELTWNHFRRQPILEYEIVKYDGDLGQPNCFIPISEDTLTRKTRALLTAFTSQRSKPWFTRSTFESIARIRGVECNSPTGYAEAFHARKVCLNFSDSN